MNKQLKELAKKGCMVHKNAVQHLNHQKVSKIKQMNPTPMFVNKKLLENMEQTEVN